MHCVSCDSDCDGSMDSPSASWVAFGDDSWLGLDYSSPGRASWGISVEGDFPAGLERFPLPFNSLNILSPQIFQLKNKQKQVTVTLTKLQFTREVSRRIIVVLYY